VRAKKNSEIRKGMCERFVVAMQQLALSPAQMARELGYSNAATISKLQKGEAFVDVERLYHLARLRTPQGDRIDLNWLITGDGMRGGRKE
jgi:hypothetical protein